ncbi:hypothetical protein HMPREF3038_02668 [Akkermansia sp. KLE1797]|nr:hypothetical protein HMPREF3038_02668 [Akkermansia sp. KLE1797]KXU53024.1 hypothetical protein HMPREF3039_02784 [Akkermansia sp. KLE1798]KZA03664.1 hypothetical protein HMPREF1326_02641 [Akkermansia sp. KLE1605]
MFSSTGRPFPGDARFFMWSFLWSGNSGIVIMNMLWHHPPELFHTT